MMTLGFWGDPTISRAHRVVPAHFDLLEASSWWAFGRSAKPDPWRGWSLPCHLTSGTFRCTFQ